MIHKSKIKVMARNKTSMESIFLSTGKKGKIMYSTKKGKDIEAIMAYYKRDAKTEVCYCICPKTMVSQKITKITLN